MTKQKTTEHTKKQKQKKKQEDIYIQYEVSIKGQTKGR